MTTRPQAPAFVGTLALLGIVGGWRAAEAFDIPGSSGVLWVLMASTMALCALVGWALARTHRAPLWPLRVIFFVIIAGMLNGAVVGACAAGINVATFGALMGAFAAVPFVPAIGAVVVFTRHVGRARPHSLLARLDQRAVLRASALVAALGIASFRRHDVAAWCIAPVALLALWLVWRDVGMWRQLRRRVTRNASGALVRLDLPAVGVLDLGVGDGVRGWRHAEPDDAPFRDSPREEPVLVGDWDAAQSAFMSAFVLDALALASALVATCRSCA